jgi:hypothetical protein
MHSKRSRIALLALTAALATTPVAAGGAPAWKPVKKAGLEVTEGTISSAGKVTLRTRSAAMRAVARDGGRHATRAQLRFKLLGASETVKPLGSGQIRRQIGLKLRAADPCNLLYVMWHAAPDSVVEISVKRNAGQTTSAQCGNRGYTELASLPMPAPDRRLHVLEARTRRAADGSLVLAVYADGRLLRRMTLPADTAAGLEGPIGVRSDNGDYLFRLSARR